MNLLEILLKDKAKIISPITIRKDREIQDGYKWIGRVTVEHQEIKYSFQLHADHKGADNLTYRQAIKLFHLTGTLLPLRNIDCDNKTEVTV